MQSKKGAVEPNGYRLPRQQPRTSHQQQSQLHDSLAGNKGLLQEGRQVHLANRMTPLRGLREAFGVREDAHQGCTYPGGRRTAQAGAREPEHGHEAPGLEKFGSLRS
jgi:hypothetical protein